MRSNRYPCAAFGGGCAIISSYSDSSAGYKDGADGVSISTAYTKPLYV